MTQDLKKMYRTVMEDHFPDSLRITFGDQELVYRKRSWKFPDDKSGELIEGIALRREPGPGGSPVRTDRWAPHPWRLSFH